MIPVLHGVWSAGGVGDYEHIETVTVGSGGASSVTFSSIAGTYKHLQIRGIARCNANGGSSTVALYMRMNSDSGANYTTSHVLYGNGASALSAASATSQSQGAVTNYPQSASTTNSFGPFVADILDYASTSKYKTVRCLGGYDGNDTNGIVVLRSFAWMSTSAITSLYLFDTSSPANGFAQHSSFSLYGVK